MAVVKPLVEQNGEIQALQPGDSLDAGSDDVSRTFTVAMVVGEAVYADTNTSVNKAQGNADGTSKVMGIVKTAAGAGLTGVFVHDGLLQLSTSQWDAVAGTTGGLTANTYYYLSNAAAGALLEAGSLTGIGAGEYVIQVGKALSTTEMLVKVGPRILR